MSENTDWAQVINWVLTIMLIVLVAYATHQRYFAKLNCQDELKDIVQNVYDFNIENPEERVDMYYNTSDGKILCKPHNDFTGDWEECDIDGNG